MLVIVFRTIILYFIVLFIMRVMGKAELSKLDPFQMVILFMIAELAAIPIESIDVPVFTGIAAIITLLLLEVSLSFLSTKSQVINDILAGKPSILIHHGKINMKELKSQRISVTDLMQYLRIKNYPSLADVDYAILEANGELSVIPKPEKAAVKIEDMNITAPSTTMPMILISDGNLYRKNLLFFGKDENYLKKELARINITDYSQVFLCFFDEKRQLHVYPKEKGNKNMFKEVRMQ